MICNLIPSQRVIKLGFAYGVSIPDPENILQGTGKISRYIEIISDKQIQSQGIKDLLKAGFDAHNERCLD
ncbi:MAG: hypothetical protein ACK5B9_06680 [Flavobacteriia bacterium]|jgi:hypothetical protein